MRKAWFALLVVLLALPAFGGRSRSPARRSPAVSSHHVSKKRAPNVARDSHGRIKRSARARDEFRRTHPCPATGRTRGTCPGYVIDHVRPLKRGGPDRPSNMQWQTKAAARAKDRIE